MTLERILIKKLLKFRGSGYLSFLSFFTVAGIFVGVSALVIVIAVMTGFHNEIKNRILGITPHIVVSQFFDRPFNGYEKVESEIKIIKGVEEVIPFAIAKVMIKHQDYADGGIVRGIIRKNKALGDYLKKRMVFGKFEIEDNKVVMGVDIASRLRVSDGDTIVIYSPFLSKITPLGTVMKAKKYIVSGVFDAGYFDFNATLLITNIKNVQELLGYGDNYIQGFEIFLKDPYSAKALSSRIEDILGYPFRADNWMDMNKSLFSALKLEKLAMFLILILIIFVASFNMITTLLMLLIRKTREIGILRSLGYKKKDVFRLFIIQGMYLGSIGVFLGVIFGSLISMIADKFKIIKLPPDVYFIDYMPLSIKPLDVVVIMLAALFVIFLSTLYPARKASSIILKDAIKYE
jgi:lipoprotein-releasing system permease protein